MEGVLCHRSAKSFKVFSTKSGLTDTSSRMPSTVPRVTCGDWRHRQHIQHTIYTQHTHKTICSYQTHGVSIIFSSLPAPSLVCLLGGSHELPVMIAPKVDKCRLRRGSGVHPSVQKYPARLLITEIKGHPGINYRSPLGSNNVKQDLQILQKFYTTNRVWLGFLHFVPVETFNRKCTVTFSTKSELFEARLTVTFDVIYKRCKSILPEYVPDNSAIVIAGGHAPAPLNFRLHGSWSHHSFKVRNIQDRTIETRQIEACMVAEIRVFIPRCSFPEAVIWLKKSRFAKFCGYIWIYANEWQKMPTFLLICGEAVGIFGVQSSFGLCWACLLRKAKAVCLSQQESCLFRRLESTGHVHPIQQRLRLAWHQSFLWAT